MTNEPTDPSELPDPGELPDADELATAMPANGPTGDYLVHLASRHRGEPYVLGARAPMTNAGWVGPWDCAEFVSWVVYQAAGILYGTLPRNDPLMADAYTGFWAEQSRAGRHTIAVADAAAIPGAAMLRKAVGSRIGHIVLSDGRGGTVEAHSSALGVIAGTLSGRRWDCGVLVPGIRYFRSETAPVVQPPPPDLLRLTSPPMRGPRIAEVQELLRARGFAAGKVDGVYGPQTAHAVRLFQAASGLVADGEVGPSTLQALKSA